VTRIHHGFEGDTWFPEFDESEWRPETRSDFEADNDNPYAYSLIKFVREI
jgi:dihydrofolate reductase